MRNTVNANRTNFNFFPVNEQVLNSISLNAQEEGIPLWDRDVKRYIY